MKKIVILYSTSGLGHFNSAKAIMQAFKREYPDVEVKFINILDYGNNFFQFFHFKFYVSLMKHAKKLWGVLYYISDLFFFDVLVRAFRHFADQRSWKGLTELLENENPDAIVATHFFITSIARSIKNNTKIKSKLFLMVSGYGMHNIWASKHIDHFFTSNQQVYDQLIKRDILPHRISVTGMAAPEEFSKSYDEKALIKKMDLYPDKKTVFVLGGAFGAAPMADILNALKDCTTKIQVIVVCGYNKIAFQNIRKIENTLGYPVRLYGFTDNIPELMAVSDIMISKAGTLSVTQALNMRLPMILFSHVPGHETPTVKFIVKQRAGVYASKVDEISELLDETFSSSDLYDEMKRSIDNLRRPNAADYMVDIIMDELDSGS